MLLFSVVKLWSLSNVVQVLCNLLIQWTPSKVDSHYRNPFIVNMASYYRSTYFF